MNFTKKRNVVIQFISNAKGGLFTLIVILCLIFVPYLYALALGYNTSVLPDVVSVWMIGFLLIMGCAAWPTILLLVIIISILENIKVAKITCRLPLTEEEMDEFSKNKTCEEILMEMEEFLTYTVFGRKYCVYKNYKYRKFLTPFFLYISKNYADTEFGEGFAFMRDVENLIAKESNPIRVSYFG